jgi:hypothetical protein
VRWYDHQGLARVQLSEDDRFDERVDGSWSGRQASIQAAFEPIAEYGVRLHIMRARQPEARLGAKIER